MNVSAPTCKFPYSPQTKLVAKLEKTAIALPECKPQHDVHTKAADSSQQHVSY